MNRTLKPLLLGLAAAGLPLTAATAANIELGKGNAALDLPADAALTAAPGTLYVNGVEAGNMVQARIDPATGHIWVKGDMSVGDGGGYGGPGGDPEDPPPVDPPPVDPPSSGSCEKWAALGERPVQEVTNPTQVMDLGNEVKAFKFTANAASKTLAVNSAAGQSNQVRRTVWISSCPGGAPLSSYFLIKDGNPTAAVNYRSGDQEKNSTILSGGTYYFNVANAYKATPAQNTCSRSSCRMIPSL